MKGDVPAPAPGEQMPQIVYAPVGQHSEKPAIFAEMIEKMFPNVPMIELFARRRRPGWAVWGNEVPDDKREPRHRSEPHGGPAMTDGGMTSDRPSK